MRDEKYSLLDITIVSLVLGIVFAIIIIAMLEINSDLAKQVDYYKEMYHEKDGAVRLLQERYGVK